jgi:predicted metal-binding transcription factor (methanogenesis marker protein 9)
MKDKQMAVEWLENQLKLRPSDWIEIHPYFEQAKKMEKEQMIEFGELVWKNLLRSDKIRKPRDVYNETYGGNK